MQYYHLAAGMGRSLEGIDVLLYYYISFKLLDNLFHGSVLMSGQYYKLPVIVRRSLILIDGKLDAVTAVKPRTLTIKPQFRLISIGLVAPVFLDTALDLTIRRPKKHFVFNQSALDGVLHVTQIVPLASR